MALIPNKETLVWIKENMWPALAISEFFLIMWLVGAILEFSKSELTKRDDIIKYYRENYIQSKETLQETQKLPGR